MFYTLGARNESKQTAEVDELDFFGFNSTQKPKEKAHERCEMSVKSNIQEPVGNSSVNKVRKVRGSKPRRKRKLSEGALEEQLMEDEARRQASLLLAPPKSKAKKCDAHCRRSSMELVKSKEVFEQSDEEAAVSSEEEGQDVEEEEDEEEEVAVRLFKLHGKSVDEEMTVTQKVKKTKKGAAQKSTDDSADRYVRCCLLSYKILGC